MSSLKSVLPLLIIQPSFHEPVIGVALREYAARNETAIIICPGYRASISVPFDRKNASCSCVPSGSLRCKLRSDHIFLNQHVSKWRIQVNSTLRPNLLSESAIVAGTHRNSRDGPSFPLPTRLFPGSCLQTLAGSLFAVVRLAPNSIISIHDVPEGSWAIVAHSHCTMPGACKSCLSE